MKVFLTKFGIIILVAVAVLGGGFAWFKNHQYGKLWDEHTALQALQKEKEKVIKEKDAFITALKETQKESEKKEAALLEQINGLEAEKVKDRIALATEKEKTKQLTNSEIASKIGTYIGGTNIAELSTGLFSLTRPGADNTYNKFLDLTACQKQLETTETQLSKALGSTAECDNAKNALIGQVTVLEQQKKELWEGWDLCKLDTKNLTKLVKVAKWKGRIQGLVGGGIIALAVIFGSK
jgi:hypothetical protein